MKNRKYKFVICVFCSVFIIVSHYGLLMRHIFWDSTLFCDVTIPQSVSIEIYDDAKLYYPLVDSYGNLSIWKPSSNQWSRDFNCRYLTSSKEIVIETPEMFIDLSNSKVTRSSDSQSNKLSEYELIELLTDYARTGKKIDDSKFTIETVWLGRECYEVISIDDDISGELVTYSSGAGTERRMQAIPVEWTNYKEIHIERLFSWKDLLIAASIAIVYLVLSITMLKMKAGRVFWIVSILSTIESIIVIIVGIYNR